MISTSFRVLRVDDNPPMIQILSFTKIPTRRGMGVGVVDDRFIWTFGGFDGEKVDDVIEMCDIKTGEWM